MFILHWVSAAHAECELGRQRPIGQEGWLLCSDASMLRKANELELCGQAELRTESQGYSSTFISVIRQNVRPITASNPSDDIDGIILACCVSCPVWEAGQSSFLWAVLLEGLIYSHPHNLCRKYFILQILF